MTANSRPQAACRTSRDAAAPSVVLLLLVGAAASLAQEAVAPATRADFYVAVDGNDAWSGTLAEANAGGTDGPFATLERAREAVRKLRETSASQRPLVVQLRGGTHRRQELFVLRPEDSGTEASPVVYESYPGERAVLSGGRTISGWEKADGPLWKVELAEVKSGAWNFRQLFVDGKRRHRSRFPKEGTLTLANLPPLDTTGWMAEATEDPGELPKRAFQYRPGDLCPSWTNIDDIEVVVLQFWMEARLRVQRLDDENHVVLFTGGSWRPLTWSKGYYVDNVFEGIDAPGTWYLNRKQGVLYYHPLPEEDMTRIEVVAPRTEQLVRFEGDVAGGRFVRDVTLRGLTFSHTSWPFPKEGYAWPQGELPAPAAVYANGAHRCRFEGCQWAHLGAWGIELRRGCKDNTIAGNLMRDLGAGGVKIGEPEDCEKDVEETCRTVISDNRFLDGAHVYLGPPAVWIGQSSGNTVSHNEMSGPFQWAVSVGWRWSYFPLQRARDNLVEFNHVHHLGTGVLGSHAAIYALGTSPGTVIRNNYVHHCPGHGICLDNGCCGILVENNVVHHALHGPYCSNFNCYGNVIQNNVFAYGKEFQLTVFGDLPHIKQPPKGEVFARNIVVWREGPLIRREWKDFNTLWDYNLYFNELAEPITFAGLSFSEWKAEGLGQHSIIADPLFVDPAGGDFSLKPESPAFELGFRPI
ncbi:MAG: right-handed parallel beta-helix repeat-containing protein, partial [Planctomycetota bacterium]